jgi:hypothetical protein
MNWRCAERGHFFIGKVHAPGHGGDALRQVAQRIAVHVQLNMAGCTGKYCGNYEKIGFERTRISIFESSRCAAHRGRAAEHDLAQRIARFMLAHRGRDALRQAAMR